MIVAKAVSEASPNWASITTAVATAVTAGVLGITVVVIWWQLRDARRTRHAELLIDLSRRWDEPVINEAEAAFAGRAPDELAGLVRRVYVDAPDPNDLDQYIRLVALPNLCETLAVLHSERAISLRTIWLMWGTPLQKVWVGWELAATQIRHSTKAPRAYAELERLAGELASYKERRWRRR